LVEGFILLRMEAVPSYFHPTQPRFRSRECSIHAILGAGVTME
jgi:hypothetical protein